MDEFVVFTVIIVKMHRIRVDCGGSVVLKNHMYAAIHCVITGVIAPFDESSKFIDANSNFLRLERPSCLGSALHHACFLEFPFAAKIEATCYYSKKATPCFTCFALETLAFQCMKKLGTFFST